MTGLQRLGLEIAAAVLLCGAFIGWWQLHNHTEQKIGAEKCIISTTEVKSEAKADNAAAVAGQGIDLQLVVKTYDQHIADLSRSNADLARRLSNNALRQSGAAGAGSAACEVRAVELSGGQSDPELRPLPATIEAHTAKVFSDCDADHEALIGVTAAYNDWRTRMIALQ